MHQSDIVKRLDNFIEYEALMSQTQFAIKAGVHPSNFSKMMSGKQTLTKATLKKIADTFSLNPDWLLNGEGEMYATNEPTPKISYTDGVPYYDEDFLLGFEEVAAPNSENPDFLIRMPGYEKATLWCNASGHSMEPEINNGDIIALQRVEDFSFLPFGDVYGFVTTNGMRTIKRLGRSAKEGYYRLIPTNKDYDEQEIPINKIALVYRVMGTMKSF